MSTLVPGQQYSPEQIYQNDPDWLKANNPALYSQFVQQVGQPAAGLQSTVLSNTEKQGTILPTIKSAVANSNITQQEADKQAAFNDTQSLFEGAKDSKTGKVSPQTYNKALENASKYMTSDEFNSRFQDPYTNQNDVHYNTPENKKIQQTLPQIGNIVKSYYGLTKNGPTWDALTKVPLLGDYFKKVNFNDEIAHDAALKGTAAEILKAAGAGAGSTIRGNLAELGQVTGMLPSAADARATADKKMDKLDNFLQKTYGISLKDYLK